MKNVRETSIKAYYEILESGLISDIQKKLMRIFLLNGAPMSARQVYEVLIQKRLPSAPLLQTVRARVNELYSDWKLLDEVGQTTCEHSGKTVLLFQPPADPPSLRKMTALEKLDREINSLELRLIERKQKRTILKSESIKRYDAAEQSRQMGLFE